MSASPNLKKMKKNAKNLLFLAAIATMVGCFSHNSSGQGNFDRAQFRQDQLDRYRDRLEVKSDDDWKKIEPLIGKVMDAQREARMGMGGFGFGFARADFFGLTFGVGLTGVLTAGAFIFTCLPPHTSSRL